MGKSSFEQYQEFQDYTNYIDTSDVMLEFYKDQSGTGLQKYYLMIEEWLSMNNEYCQSNKPLVIQAEGGVGKKTLLVKWYEYHESLKSVQKNDLVILNFATTGGNNSNYFYAIYRILIKLREKLNIEQKVELHEEKLRKYFSYWLDVCHQRIENQIIHNVQTVHQKIILVFQGIDYFVDPDTGKEGNIAFWLPKYFPKNVKVIVTADRQSQSMNYFNKLGCPKVNIPADLSIIKTMIKWQNQKDLCVDGQIRQDLVSILEENIKNIQVTSLYVKSYLSCFMPQKLGDLSLSNQSLLILQKCICQVSRERLRKLTNVDQLFNYVLDFWGNILFQCQDKFKELIGLLISTQKGLTQSEIIAITKIDPQQLKLFITIFRIFLMNFKDLWMIKNDSFKRAINTKYQFNTVHINQKIADVLLQTPNSVRKLQEQTFQLYSAQNYFKLKEVISDIQNFLLLFNPYTKYDLCRYWQKLEEKSFDPVIEYNKAIQGFQMHYHPTSDDLFRIITQISRFLRQFSDFETYYTPEFRHPKLIGNMKQLEDIGIFGQFKNLALCEQNESLKNEEDKKYQETSEQFTDKNEDKKLKTKLQDMYRRIDEGIHTKKIPKIQNKQQNSKDKDKDKMQNNNAKKNKEKQIAVQKLNVEVKSNQQLFRKHYYEEIKPFLQKINLQGEKQYFTLDEENDDDFDEQEEQSKSENLMNKIKNIQKQKSKFQNLPDLKNLYTKTIEEQFELNQKPPTNYYYKRWIWMQFPWVCMTMKCDYSEKLRKCFTSPTSYMSVAEERQFTVQALKIALEAKKKKQTILKKQEGSTKTHSKTVLKVNPMNITQFNKCNDKSKTSAQNNSKIINHDKKQNRMQELGFVTNSFLSMSNLSKQMQMINQTTTFKDTSQLIQNKDTLFLTSNPKQKQHLNDQSSLLKSFKKRKMNVWMGDELNKIEKNAQGILPKIKQNVNNEMQKQLECLQKNNVQIRKDMDNYIYKNKVLAKKLKQLKIIQYNNMDHVRNQKKVEQKKNKVEEIQKKIEKVKYQYAYSLLEHERLDKLIKICKKNKTHNEQAIPQLVIQCNNFKKMIKIESNAIQELKKKTDQVKKLTKKFVNNCCQKIQNQMNLQQEIKATIRNRQNFKGQVQRYDKIIAEKVEEKRKQINQQLNYNSQNKDQSHLNFDKNKNYKEIQEDEENYQEIYFKLSQYIDFNQENYKNDPKYQKLLDGLNKKRQFESVIEEKKIELEKLQKKYNNKKRQLETLQRAKQESQVNAEQDQDDEQQYEYQPQNSQNQSTLQKQLQQKKRILAKTINTKVSCLGMLNTWYSKLGLPEQSKLIITQEFVDKVSYLKQKKIKNQIVE